jgi:hypothetical protein
MSLASSGLGSRGPWTKPVAIGLPFPAVFLILDPPIAFIMNSSTHAILARCVLVFGFPALLGASVLLPTPAAAITLSSTVAEDNGATTNATDPGNTSPDPNQDVYISPNNHPGVLTTGGGATGTGYDFGSSYSALTQISAISITLTMLNGSSATAAQETAGGNPTSVDDYDVNQLVLYVGGTFSSVTGLTGGTEVLQANGTPLYLNGFLTNDAQSTLSFNNIQLSPATGNAIVAALQASGGFLTAFVGTTNTNDSSPVEGAAGTGYGPAEIFLGNTGDPTVANATTTLSLTGVPEPGTTALLLAGGALLLLATGKRSRRAV